MAATIAWLAGCANVPSSRTEVVVRIEADPSVELEATRLHVAVRAGPGRPIDPRAPVSEHDYPRAGALRLPFELGLIPPAGSGARFFDVTATAHRLDETAIVSGRVISGYVEGTTLLLVLRLEDGCSVPCAAEQTCRAGGCVDAFVEATTLPWYVDRPTEVATLRASDGAAGDELGFSVALSQDGTRALVGAPSAAIASGARPGSARVFLRTGTMWSEEATLIAADGAGDDSLGWSVALSADGSRALLGAVHDETTAGTNAGSAHVFVRTGATWTEEATLLPSDPAAGDSFGGSVALTADGTRALVGASRTDTGRGRDAGSARVFLRTGTAWTEEATLIASDGAEGDRLGDSVALTSDGTRALVGAPDDDVAVSANAGSARVFLRTGTTWTEEATLVASDGLADDELGGSVALTADGTRAISGAYLDDTSAGPEAGSARVFLRTGTTWTEEATLLADDAAAYEGFAVSVALSSDGLHSRALVGMPFDDGTGEGSVRVFSRTGASWTEEARLVAPDRATNDYFGYSVALSSDGSETLVGAYLDDRDGDVDTGSARVFALPP